jgi:membrane-associated protease RseP (regulator of RpoE activity)
VKDPLETEERVETRHALTVALLVTAALVFIVLARPSIAVTVALIVGLVLTVMLHEAGHFLVAKRSGMKVTEFFLGFGPRIWSVRRGETEYGVKAIPAGGYVRIIGMNNVEEVEPGDEPRTYRQASFPKRLATVLAGVAVNLVIAALLIYLVLLRVGEPTGPSTTISTVTGGMPAAEAGFREGDRILEIDGRPIEEWEDVPAAIQPNANRLLDVVVERGGETVSLAVTPERDETDERGLVGISPAEGRASLGPVSAFRETGVQMWDATVATVDGIARIFSPAGVERQVEDVTRAGPRANRPEGVDVERPRSVIGIVSIGDEIVQGDVWVLLYLFAAINLFLALFNLIPLLPFDGGHAAIACYEAVASRVRGRDVRVDYRRLIPVTAMVLAVLLVFGVSTMFLDIREIITGS